MWCWLAEPAIPARGYRDDFFLKIMAATRSADPATLPAVLTAVLAVLCLLPPLGEATAEASADAPNREPGTLKAVARGWATRR